MSERYFLLFVLALVIPISTTAQSPADCKECFAAHACVHFPVPAKCFDCCAYDSGKIASVSSSGIVLSQQNQQGETGTKEFVIDKDTQKSGRLRSGAQATVFHKTSQHVAESIEVVDDSPFLLRPGNEQDPPTNCPGPIPSDALKVFLAELVGWTSADEVVVLQSDSENLLALRSVPNGLAINATLYGKDHDVIARVVDNQLYLNASGSAEVEPGSHSLVIGDKITGESIQFQYLNKHSLRIAGTIYTPSGTKMTIGSDVITINRNHIGGPSCIANTPPHSVMFHF